MKVNLKGSVLSKSKHFGCEGNYYGFGSVAKYNIKNNLSVFQFAQKKDMNQNIIHKMIDTMSENIDYSFGRISSSFPNITNYSFSMMEATNVILQENDKSTHHLSKEILKCGVDKNCISTSNWVCQNAATKEFHQELDSSYTIVTVPQWDHEDLKLNNKFIGRTKFVFKWTNDTEINQSYFPIELTDGLSMSFTGFSCSHCQERIINSTRSTGTNTTSTSTTSCSRTSLSTSETTSAVTATTNNTQTTARSVRTRGNGDFYNICSYQNKRYHANLRRSIIRCIQQSSSDNHSPEYFE